MAKNKNTAVPPQGTLGLLAQGAKGIRAWRLAQEKSKTSPIQKPNTHG
jgi:hypothetical protein